jgi:hypothetical protein
MNRNSQSQTIFMIAPWRRCGTTLLQRALNSSGSAIIYGENWNFLEEYPSMVADITSRLGRKQALTASIRRRVLSGDYNIDASAMFPDYDSYARLMCSHFYAIAQYYERLTQSYGRQIWGLKHQLRRIKSFSIFLKLLPHARYIFVYRNIFDIVRSDKARFPKHYADLARFSAAGKLWARNTEFLRRVSGSNVLHIEHDELSADVSGVIAKIEAHSGVTGIQPEVFATRINVGTHFDKLSEVETKTGYRPPVDLSRPELAALLSAVEEPCRQLGYAIPEWVLASSR